MISRKFTIWACGLLFVFGSCAEDMVKPIENDKDAPGTVQDVKTESLPGSCEIHLYTSFRSGFAVCVGQVY